MRIFAPALIFCGAVAGFGQTPQVPHKMQFAGMTLTIRDDARREIQKDVDALTISPKYFGIKAERAKTYFPTIERIFAEERLPDDFKYLALQESALVPDAVSSSNAVGFWQFKDFTAIEMGLRVDKHVDERMNISSASRGAAKYLKQCNHYFNNWIYALQAYQMGAGGVLRSVGDKDAGARHMEITSGTYWYIKKFLAHKVAFENSITGEPAIVVSNLNSAGGKSLKQLSIETSIEEDRLREFNRWLKSDEVPTDREYAFLIPKGEGNPDFSVLAVQAQKAKPVMEIASSQPEMLEVNGIPVIRANQGESIANIAERGGVSISRFLKYNEIQMSSPLQAGSLYFLKKKKNRAQQELYTVSAGDDLWKISHRYGVRQRSLEKFNNIERDQLQIGTTLFLSHQKLLGDSNGQDSVVAVLNTEETFGWELSGGKSETRVSDSEDDNSPDIENNANAGPMTNPVATTTGASIHEVKSADTLYSVARQYGVTIQQLMEWNNKKDFTLSLGEKLKVRSH